MTIAHRFIQLLNIRFSLLSFVPLTLLLLALLFVHFKIMAQEAPVSDTRQKPAIQLAKRYHQGVNVQAYWVSEKLDGVRAYWNGSQLISRRGTVFEAPNWFTAAFPNVPLDGELWIGRGQFDLVSGIVRTKMKSSTLTVLPSQSPWHQVKFMIFDLPTSTVPFTQVVGQMQDIVQAANSPYLAMIPQQRIANNSALDNYLTGVIDKGGEGLMLHLAQAVYAPTRNSNVLKLKRHQDAEAVVIAHLAGKGKYKGMLGSIRVRDREGVEFNLGSGLSDAMRLSPPPIGTVVTFKYYGKTANNVPRFASFLRIRR